MEKPDTVRYTDTVRYKTASAGDLNDLARKDYNISMHGPRKLPREKI